MTLPFLETTLTYFGECPFKEGQKLTSQIITDDLEEEFSFNGVCTVVRIDVTESERKVFKVKLVQEI